MPYPTIPTVSAAVAALPNVTLVPFVAVKSAGSNRTPLRYTSKKPGSYVAGKTVVEPL